MPKKIVDIENLKEFRKRIDEKYVIEGEYSPDTSVGYADESGNLRTREGEELVCGTNDEPFGFRPTAYPFDESVISVGEKATLKKIWAYAFVKNQLAGNPNFDSNTSWTATYGTLSYNTTNGIGTFTATGANPNARIQQTKTFVSGHKYLVLIRYKASVAKRFKVWCGGAYSTEITTTADVWSTYFYTVSSPATDTEFGVYCLSMENNDTIQYDYVYLIDLTQWFNGDTDIINSAHFTPSWFINNFGKYIPSTQNLGEIVNVWATGIKTCGVNIWDEEWELGGIHGGTGENTTDNTTFRSKNYVRVLPNKTYYLKGSINYFFFYDSNKNYLGSSTILTSIVNTTFNTPTNACYLKFVKTQTTYGNDIQISNHWTETTIENTYHAYESWLFNIDWSFVGEGNTPQGINAKVGDYKDYENGKNGVAVGITTITLAYNSDLGLFSTATKVPNANRGASFICAKGYTNSGYVSQGSMADKTVQIVNSDLYGVWLKDSSLDTSSTIEITLQYRLATPTLTDMTEGEQLNNTYNCNDYGNELILNGNDESVACLDVLYQKNLARQIVNNEDAINNINNRIPELPSGSADGTYSLKATKSGTTITYSWVADTDSQGE